MFTSVDLIIRQKSNSAYKSDDSETRTRTELDNCNRHNMRSTELNSRRVQQEANLIPIEMLHKTFKTQLYYGCKCIEYLQIGFLFLKISKSSRAIRILTSKLIENFDHLFPSMMKFNEFSGFKKDMD